MIAATIVALILFAVVGLALKHAPQRQITDNMKANRAESGSQTQRN